MKIERSIYLSINHTHGSVEHYYHYLLGYLLPLVKWYKSSDVESSCLIDQICVRSCGILDKHTKQLQLHKLNIVNKYEHATKASICAYTSAIKGYDDLNGNVIRDIITARDILLDKFYKEQEKHNTPSVLLINRADPDPFYNTENCEVKTASNQRRSIPNFNDLVDSISRFNPTVAVLEHTSLSEQINMFRNHNIIIAQHGAALSNVVFCREGTYVLEICPKDKQTNYFNTLSNHMKLVYNRLMQNNSHSNVDIDIFKSQVDALIKAKDQALTLEVPR